MGEKPSDFGTQSGSAKSALVAQIARLVRKAGLDYDGWRYVAKLVRKTCDLKPAKKGKKLPRVLTADDFRKFYAVVDKADDVQHSLMLRLLFYTGVRVSELCNMQVANVDLEACKIRWRAAAPAERSGRNPIASPAGGRYDSVGNALTSIRAGHPCPTRTPLSRRAPTPRFCCRRRWPRRRI
jgi:integrase